MTTRAERRGARRGKPAAGFQVASPAFAGPASVRDLSSSGLCCTTDRALPVLSQVHLVLVLPAMGGGTREVSCDGAVVRSARERTAQGAAAAYETAIFFTKVDDDDRHALEQYVAGLPAAHRVA